MATAKDVDYKLRQAEFRALNKRTLSKDQVKRATITTASGKVKAAGYDLVVPEVIKHKEKYTGKLGR